MIRNPLIDMAADMFTAIAALKLRAHRLVSTSEGVEVHQPGKPVLLLTHQAARDVAHQREEAQFQ